MSAIADPMQEKIDSCCPRELRKDTPTICIGGTSPAASDVNKLCGMSQIPSDINKLGLSHFPSDINKAGLSYSTSDNKNGGLSHFPSDVKKRGLSSSPSDIKKGGNEKPEKSEKKKARMNPASGMTVLSKAVNSITESEKFSKLKKK